MALLDSYRQKRGQRELHKLYDRHRPVYQSDWQQVRTIGILYNGSNPALASQVRQFVTMLTEEGKIVTSLGYFPTKDDKQIPASEDGFPVFSKKDLDGKFLPKSGISKAFTEQEFDVLLDLNVENLFPLFAISSLSQAKFKAGLDIPENGHLSLTIHLDPHQNFDQLLHYLLDNLQKYLREIRK